jgi:hypothetical protein
MILTNRIAGIALAIIVTGVSAASAQPELADVLARYGVQAKAGAFDQAFDAHAAPTIPVTAGAFATPLAVLTSTVGAAQVDGAYAFGILAGRSGRAASPQELMAAGEALTAMIRSTDRRTRIAGARVAGRIFAASYDRSGTRPVLPAGMTEAIFAMLNQDAEVDQLAAMDALGLLRDVTAVTALTERYHYYRDGSRRALAGGALEALARIGDASSVAIVKALAGDPWAEGRDATALAIAFARERLLKDGSIAVIRKAMENKSLRNQARGYLDELGAPAP